MPASGDHLRDLVRGEQVALVEHQRPFGQEVVRAQRHAAPRGQPDHADDQRAAQPQAAGLGDDQVVDIAVGDVVHGQRAGHGDHAHERQVADHAAVAHGPRQ